MQYWNDPIVEPNGNIVTDAKYASSLMGQRWSFTGDVLDDQGHTVGKAVETCSRLNKRDKWSCDGTMINLYGCHGLLTFTGPFSDLVLGGKYVITGGTGAFDGATGYISETFHYSDLYAYRTIVIR